MTFFAFPDFPPVLAYIARVHAEEIARAVEYVRAQIPAVVPASSTTAVERPDNGLGDSVTSRSGVGGGCFDQPYVPAYIVQRESGGDPTVYNGGGHSASPYESGGRSWGCFQFMPGTWDANCSDLAPDVPGQIECARRVSSDGTNLRPWAL